MASDENRTARGFSKDQWEPTRRFFEALNELREDETLHIEGCYLPGDHDGPCRACAACDGDPEALGMHVCGRDFGA